MCRASYALLAVTLGWCSVLAGCTFMYGSGLTPTRKKLMIFGGLDHKTYLGCLSCDATMKDSIFDEFGAYGHCRALIDDNLFCSGLLANYGGDGLHQTLSACSSMASNPPVIVDEAGKYYGRFAIGGIAAHHDSVCRSFGKFHSEELCEIVEWVCSDGKRG